MGGTKFLFRGGYFFAPLSHVFATDDTVGALLPSIEGLVVSEEGCPLPRNQTGEIWVRCPFFMRGYHRDSEETVKTLTRDGWLRTGDMGRVNDQDKWYVSGRKKDQYIVEGLHVSGNEIAVALLQHPKLVDVCVIPVKPLVRDLMFEEEKRF